MFQENFLQYWDMGCYKSKERYNNRLPIHLLNRNNLQEDYNTNTTSQVYRDSENSEKKAL